MTFSTTKNTTMTLCDNCLRCYDKATSSQPYLCINKLNNKYFKTGQKLKTTRIMKRSTQLLVAAFLTLLISASVFASDKSAKEAMASSIKILPKGDDGFKLLYAWNEPATLDINIYDSEDNLVFTESLKNQKPFIRPFSLNGMKSDNYRVEIMDEDGYMLKEEYVDMRHQSDFTANIWSVPNSDNYRVVVPECEDGVSLTIYNEKGKQVHFDRLKSANGISKVYDLSGLSGDEFTFKITKRSKTLKEVTL